MTKVPLASKVIGQKCHNNGRVSGADRFSIKYLQAINVCNDLVTVHLVQTEEVRGGIRTMFTDPANHPYKQTPVITEKA
jgi:hypothetical protein